MSLKRLKQELKGLEKNPSARWSAAPVNDDFSHWSATILGPEGSPYEDGVFLLDIQFPADYPFKGPTVAFITKIYHPNISEGGGMSGVPECLRPGSWSPAITISKLLQSIHLMLAEPQPTYSLRADCARQCLSDKPAFERAARGHTAKYAVPANKLGEAALKRLRRELESFEEHAVTRETHAAECQAHAAERQAHAAEREAHAAEREAHAVTREAHAAFVFWAVAAVVVLAALSCRAIWPKKIIL